MREHNKIKEEAAKELQTEEDSLAKVREQWQERMTEKRKREDLQAIIDRKKEEQQKREEILNKAAQFMQAHWRGLITRRELERGRKGKKGRGRKGKKWGGKS